MIKIKRSECPPSLNKPDNDIVKSDYSREDVINELYNMQNSKCCYCEKDLSELGTTSRHVEHYIPSSSFKDDSGDINWGLANTWENLLYACSDCNLKKTSRDPIDESGNEYLVINPSCEEYDPEDHITFVIDEFNITFKKNNNSTSGDSTIQVLKFNERREIRRALRRMKSQISGTFYELCSELEDNNIAKIESLKNELIRLTSADAPYASFSRKFIQDTLERLNSNAVPALSRKLGRHIEDININFLMGYQTV